MDCCCTGHHPARHGPTMAMPRLPGLSSPITPNSVDGPLRTLSTSSGSTLATMYSGLADVAAGCVGDKVSKRELAAGGGRGEAAGSVAAAFGGGAGVGSA